MSSDAEGGLGGPVCEVCSQPMPAGSKALRVGACEFPFHVHEACQEHLGPMATELAKLCEAAEVQPDGLLWLGSWDAEPVEGVPPTG
jgi:hypothetical protein